MTGAAVPAAARRVRHDWELLTGGDQPPEVFRPAMVAGLPEPARRWLTHALVPGTPLWPSVVLSMAGEIRLGSWRPFTARQVLAPPRGFVWAAATRLSGLPVTGFDRYSSGSGRMDRRLAGLVPVVTAAGPDVTRSAAGRLAGETALVPTAFRAARWTPGADEDRTVVTWSIDAQEESAELHVEADGRLSGVVVQRWGNPDGARSGRRRFGRHPFGRHPFGRHPFGVAIEAEETFAGVTIGSALRAGWWWGTDRQPEGEFSRARITDAVFR